MRLHEHNHRNKTDRWRGRKKQRQQRLVWPGAKIITSSAFSSNVGPVIGQNVIPAKRILRKRIDQVIAQGDDRDSTTKSREEVYILSVKRPQKRQHRASSDGATQLSMELFPTTPRIANFDRCDIFVAHISNKNSLFEGVKHDAWPVGCTVKTFFVDKVLLHCLCNKRRPTKVFVSLVVNKH